MRIVRVLFSLLLLATANLALAKDIVLDVTLGHGATTEDWYQLAIWLEDKEGNYLTTLYVTNETGKEGLGNKYKTLFGVTVREEPGSLPVWAHSRKVFSDGSLYPSKAKPLPDSITGPTVKSRNWKRQFRLNPTLAAKAYYCLMEINVSQDGTPSMVFRADIPSGNKTNNFKFIGAGETNGADGKLYQLQSGFSPKNFILNAKIS